MSNERRGLLLGLGANFVLTPARLGMRGAVERADELLAETPNGWMPRQFSNPANPAVKYDGPMAGDEPIRSPSRRDVECGKVRKLFGFLGNAGWLAGHDFSVAWCLHLFSSVRSDPPRPLLRDHETIMPLNAGYETNAGFKPSKSPLTPFWLAVTTLVGSVIVAAGCSGSAGAPQTAAGTATVPKAAGITLLNVSYDPTRELYKEINAAFATHYASQHGAAVEVKQSHAASGSQARAVIDGLEADVITLALQPDVDAVARSGLVRADWANRFDNGAIPYHSVVVFVVRKGNPRNIKDWPDLVQGDVAIITPNPKTSGNGKYSLLAAWGSVLATGGSEEEAKAFVTELYKRTPVLDTGARAATATFSQKGIGDVHLTFESEAHLEVKESKGELEIIYPPRTIRVDPPVAVVDKNVDKRGTRHAAEAYLGFLYSPEGRAIIAKHHYRPWGESPPTPAPGEAWPEVVAFDITRVAKDWDDATKKFFAEGAVFDAIYQPGAGK